MFENHRLAELMKSEAFRKGLSTRREVLGENYVDNSLSKMNDFTLKLQRIITEWVWNDNWNDKTLSSRERSIINLALMTALNRPAEFRIHLRGAINNGVSQSEIEAALLQCAVYCGIPAALDSFNMAREVFSEMGLE